MFSDFSNYKISLGYQFLHNKLEFRINTADRHYKISVELADGQRKKS